MINIVRNVLAVIVGAVVCIILNGIVLNLMMKIIATPEGFDFNNPGTYGLFKRGISCRPSWRMLCPRWWVGSWPH